MHYLEGQTPLDPDEENDLIPRLTTRDELNAFEQRNIASGLLWARRSRLLRTDLLNINSLTKLHARMFDQTWRWAGTFRQTGKNIGVEPHQIRSQLVQLCADGRYWLENEVLPLYVCAVRLHHRLVVIHPFPNGNGRHARMVADLLLYFHKQEALTWGGASLDVEGETRQQYLAALREADRGRFKSLLEFATRR
ncbi:MAG TPA: mobile mystery protein B [Candidatus Obscuribacterales bacterium]